MATVPLTVEVAAESLDDLRRESRQDMATVLRVVAVLTRTEEEEGYVLGVGVK